MAPSSQSVSSFVSDRVQAGYSGALTLDERRRRMREGVEHVRSSVSPRPRRVRRHDSNSTIGSRITVSPMGYHRNDRWDTDTEPLDDTSTIHSATLFNHGMKVQETGQLHDFAPSPAPDYSTSVSGTEEEDDAASIVASVKTEPAQTYVQPSLVQGFNTALSGKGTNTWAASNHGRPRTSNSNSNSISNTLAHVNGSHMNGHAPQQHRISRGEMINASLPYHPRPSQSPSLRPREASAPPSTSPRSRAFSPAARREVLPNGYSNGYPPTSHPMAKEASQTPSIDEDAEYATPNTATYGQARQISIHHAHSMSNLSQSSLSSRAGSVSDFRSGKSANGRFRTKRSHVSSRRPRRGPLEVELDYTPLELSKMSYLQLADEDWDTGPAKKFKPLGGVEFPEGSDSLEDKCNHLSKIQDNRAASSIDAGAKSAHELFFASLPMADYEECGDIIVGQLSQIMDRLRKTRQAKRRAARDFEEEVTKREAAVSTRTDGLQKELHRLKKSGQDALAAAIASGVQ